MASTAHLGCTHYPSLGERSLGKLTSECDLVPMAVGSAAYSLGILAWVCITATFAVELNRYSTRSTWMLRFPIVLIFAGELAKLR